MLSVIPTSALEGDASNLFEMSFDELGEINVGSFFNQNVLTTSSSVFKIDADEWRKQGARTTFEALEHAPGIALMPRGFSLPVFRGMVLTQPSTGVAYILDGYPINQFSNSGIVSGALNIELGALDNIEVNRGPSSAFYGSDAYYGVIRFNSWSSEEDIVEYSIGGGSFGNKNAYVHASHGILDEVRFSIAISGSGQKNEDLDYPLRNISTLNSFNTKLTREYDSQSLHAKLHSTHGELGIYFNKVEADRLGVVLNGDYFDTEADDMLIGGRHKWHLDHGGTIELMSYYTEAKGFAEVVQRLSPDSTRLVFSDTENKRAGGGIYYRNILDEDVRYAVGYEYSWLKTPYLSFYVFPDTPEPGDASGLSVDIHSLVVEIEKELLNSKWRLLGGGRLDYYSSFGEHFSPRLGIMHFPNDRVAYKLIYQNAFRAPNSPEQAGVTGFLLGGGESLKPEIVDNIELIAMIKEAQWFVSTSLFYIESSDNIVIQNSVSNPGFREYGNLGGLTSKGIELEGSYNIREWRLFSNFTYVDAKASSDAVGSDATVAYPEFAINFGIGYLDHTQGFSCDLYIKTLLNQATTDRSTTLLNEELPSYTRADFSASIYPTKNENFEIFLNVRNLFGNDAFIADPQGKAKSYPENRISAIAGIRYLWEK